MKCKNWKENKVVKQIYELRKEYVFKHLYAGSAFFGISKVEGDIEKLHSLDITARIKLAVQEERYEDAAKLKKLLR